MRPRRTGHARRASWLRREQDAEGARPDVEPRQILERHPHRLVRPAPLALAVRQERVVGPAARAEAAADDPGVVVEEDGAPEGFLVDERAELDLDAELL